MYCWLHTLDSRGTITIRRGDPPAAKREEKGSPRPFKKGVALITFNARMCPVTIYSERKTPAKRKTLVLRSGGKKNPVNVGPPKLETM